MTQVQEAVFFHGNDQQRRDHTPVADVANGTILDLGSGLTGICTNPEGLEADKMGDVATAGVFRVLKNDGAAVTFAVGATVGWDNTNKLAVAAGLGDWDIGRCVDKAAVATDDGVYVDINR